MLGWLSTHRARNVAKREIHRVSRFISRELCELCFVGGEDNRRHCCTLG